MNLIVCSDIFGRTEALDELLIPFVEYYQKVKIVDPYSGKHCTFTDEDDAYRDFQQNCGLETLTDSLTLSLESVQGTSDLLGFSVGATATWLVTAKTHSTPIRQAICFYGSRIREYTDLEPLCPTSLIFPQREEEFSVEQIAQQLETKNRTEIIRTAYHHGFMNRVSRNYSRIGCQTFNAWLREKVTINPSA